MNTTNHNVLSLLARQFAYVAAVLGLALSLPGTTKGQMGQSPGQTTNSGQLTRRVPDPVRDLDPSRMEMPGSPIFYQKRLQMLNAAQHQSMVADTDKLLKLVADLNSQINTSNSKSLTPEQLRMVAEIEKLAHSVKDKMRLSVRSAGEFDGPAPAPPFGTR
jgi:hypothetical protein